VACFPARSPSGVPVPLPHGLLGRPGVGAARAKGDRSQALLREALEEGEGGGGGPPPEEANTSRPLQRSENPPWPQEHKRGLFLWLMQQVLLGV
jgi:hypothetical protein